MKQRLLFIAPHLSTGGMPQYLYKQIEALLEDFDVYCIEWDNVTGGVLVVQRNRILEALGDRLITLGEDKTELLIYVNYKIKPDIIHLQEIPEMFMGYGIAEKLYATDRKYRIVETSHDSSYDVTKKSHFPDKFMMVSRYQIEAYKSLNIPCELVEYPIEYKIRTKTREQLMSELGLDPNKKHVITVGLFTPRKNQAEVVEYATMLQNQPIQFHFIGNQADNFKHYWEPIMKDFPSNCTWWGERSDVDTFYQMADLFLFTSRGFATDKETMPLVIREAISWKVPSLIYNLDVYMNYFNDYHTIEYLDTLSKEDNCKKIISMLKLESKDIFHTLEGEKDLGSYEYPNSMYESMVKYGDAAGIYWATFLYHELCRFDVGIEEGDVFVDLGTNIGISSKYALLHGAKEVHCFEPDPVLVELIKKNVPSSVIYQYAIDSKSEEFELYHWPYNPVYEGPKYKCKSVTLREVLSLVNKPIDYLKIDIEGFEHNIFDDLTYEECSRFRKLFVEHHMPEKTYDFCEVLKSKGFNVSIEYGNGQNYIYAKHINPTTTTIPEKLDKTKIFIVDVYATSEAKLNLLRNCINSVKNLGCPIMIVSHCTIPEDIVKLVDYHIYDADNTFNGNHTYSFKRYEDVYLRQNNIKSHEFPIIRAMRLSIEAAKSLGYENFYFGEFDHEYSNNGIRQLIQIEKDRVNQGKDFVFFFPMDAIFGDVVGQYYESCLFLGDVNKFLEIFNSYFPYSLEDYNARFAYNFPNCLEYYFYHCFKDTNSLIIPEYAKSYFHDSNINISSYQNVNYSIILDEDGDAHLVVVNNDNIEYEFRVKIDGNSLDPFNLNSFFKIIELDKSSKIEISSYKDGKFYELKQLTYDSANRDQYKPNGSIIFENKKPKKMRLPIDITYDKSENKFDIKYEQNMETSTLISIKDINSKACIYSTLLNKAGAGSAWWAIPLPKIVIDFQNDPYFGGFLIEFRSESEELLETREIKIKDIPIKKPVIDISNTEPVFMNYEEFFIEGVYDNYDIDNCNTVFDIGANVGLWTKYILNRNAKKVYCFEPNKKAVAHLREALKNDSNTTIVEKAVYKENTSLQFYIDDNNTLVSSLIPESGHMPSYNVDAITLDQAIEISGENKIDLVKIDAEGSEFDIIENLTKETAAKIDSFLIEYHDFYFTEGMEKVTKLIQQLEDLGYLVEKSTIKKSKFIYAARTRKNYWLNKKEQVRLYNLHDFSKDFTWDTMRAGLHDGNNHMYKEMHYTHNEYTNGCIYERMGCVIEKGDVVVDLGANVGVFANAAYYKGASKVYSFEPTDAAYKCLIKNKPINCETFKMGVGDKEGFAKISLESTDDTMCASFSTEASISEYVPMTTLDSLFSKGFFDKIDFLKIDVEGYEQKVLEGLSDNNLSKVKKIALEFHSNLLSDEVSQSILDRMYKNGFKSFQLFIDDGVMRIYNLWK